jgi:hypothetical protein
VTEVDVVVRRFGGRRAAYARHPQQAARRVLTPPRHARRVDIVEQRAIGHRQVGVAHHRIGDHELARLELDAGHPATGATHDARDRRVVAERRARLVDRRGQPCGHRVHATARDEHPLDRVHVGDDGVQRQRLVRGEAGVHRLEAEDALQPLVVEERRHLAAELAERTEPDELEAGS